MSELTQERLKELWSYDKITGFFTRLVKTARSSEVGAIAGENFNKSNYIIIYIDGKNYHAHRLAWLYVTGKWPTKFVDHKDTVRSNNAWGNLREATNAQNQQNQTKPNSLNKTGYLGVGFNNAMKKYTAQITANGRVKHLGYFDDPTDAHNTYLKAKRELHSYCTI